MVKHQCTTRTVDEGDRDRPSWCIMCAGKYMQWPVQVLFWNLAQIDTDSCHVGWISLTVTSQYEGGELATNKNRHTFPLQEIDQAWYDNYWYPGLSARGYDGVPAVTMVKNQFNAGQAIFWRKSVFVKNMDEHRLFHELLKPYVDVNVEFYQNWSRNIISFTKFLHKLNNKFH